MKSASNFWIFLILTYFFFNCATQKPEPRVVPMEKAYILIRTEGSEKEINELTNVLNSNFVSNKIASDVNYYAPGRSWNINQIFTIAYNNNYDYIVLIDQVARFTIDKKTNVGGKYQIRKYHIKSSNPEWVDLGQKTCNISVRPSIDKFSEQIIQEIAPGRITSSLLNVNEDLNTKERHTGITAVDYNNLRSSEEIDIEISELKKELEKEKEKTRKAIAEKKELENAYEKELNFQKEKNQNIIEGLRAQKRRKQLKENKRQDEIFLEAKKREEDIALKKAHELERRQSEDKHLEEVKRKEESFRIKEFKKKNFNKEKTLSGKSKKSSNTQNKGKNSVVPLNKSDALIIIRGMDKNHLSFKELKEILEFELLFANIKASSQILNTKKAFDKERVLNWNKSKYNYLILINQMGEKENGISVFKISIHSEETNSDWKELDEKSCDLSDGNSLKELSDVVLKSL